MSTADSLAIQADPSFWILSFLLYLLMVAAAAWAINGKRPMTKERRYGIIGFVCVMLVGFALFFIAGTVFRYALLS